MTTAQPSERQLLADGKREKLTERLHLSLTHDEYVWLQGIAKDGGFRSLGAAVRSFLVAIMEDEDEDDDEAVDRAFTTD